MYIAYTWYLVAEKCSKCEVDPPRVKARRRTSSRNREAAANSAAPASSYNLSQLFDTPASSSTSDAGQAAAALRPAGEAPAPLGAPMEVGPQEREWANQLLTPFEQHQGPYVQTCGHAMHAECLQKYADMLSETIALSFNGYYTVFYEYYEKTCRVSS